MSQSNKLFSNIPPEETIEDSVNPEAWERSQAITRLANQLRRDRLAYLMTGDGWNMWGKRRR